MPAEPDSQEVQAEGKKLYEQLVSEDPSFTNPAVARLEDPANKPPSLSFGEAPALPTSASEWRSPRKDGFNVVLPSGNVIRVRRIMNVLKWMREGTIPNPLAEQVQGMIRGEQKAFKKEDLTEEGLLQMFELIDATVVEMAISPPVVAVPEDALMDWEPPPGSISIPDMTIEDRIFLFQVAQGGTTDIARFRRESDELVSGAPDGEGVQHPA